MSERQVVVEPDKAALGNAVAARFLEVVRDSIAQYGGATVVLTGGSMGGAVLAAARESPAFDSVDWSLVHFWWGDERWLPAGDPERNETQSREALLDHLVASGATDGSTIHAFAASDSGLTLDEAAAAYQEELARFGTNGAPFPTFDIVFLGVGPDGHIASLFPGLPGIRVATGTSIAVRSSPKPPPERLSLTLGAINSAHRVWMVMAGPDKASALGLALAGASMDEVPAAGVEGRDETIFYVDAQAATEVPESLMRTELFWTADDDQ